MTRMMRSALALLVVCALPARLAAQETPEQVVQRYFDTFRTGDYAANVALMHPDALTSMKETLLTLVGVPGATDDPGFREMFGVSNLEEFQRLDSAVLFERLLRSQLEDEEMREVLEGSQVTVLGHVMEGDTTAHVVYRMRMSIGTLQMDQVQVAPVKRANGQWRVLLTGSLAGMMGNFPTAPREDE